MVMVGWLKLLDNPSQVDELLDLAAYEKLPVSFFVYLFLTLTWFLVILYLLFIINQMVVHTQNLNTLTSLYILFFFVQSLTLSQAIYLFKGHFSFKIFILVILILLSFGVITEVQQLYIPFRTFDYYDLITNIIGVVTGVFCVKFFNK